jgi:nucleotide-binding universal stress UspA family protein
VVTSIEKSESEQNMRVLCCLDGTNVERLSQATEILSTAPSIVFGLLYVIDTGPQKDLEHTRERFLRFSGSPRARQLEMREAEKSSAKDIMKEGLASYPAGKALERNGRPEREIVGVANEWQADLVVICPRTNYSEKPSTGPKSVGHVARFVLDHAPCAVLLVR